jgi:ABC-type polysaccharide/polyol phosphate export permease
MFQPQISKTRANSAFATLALIFHSAIHQVRKSNGNAVMGLVMNIVQILVFILVLYFLLYLLGGSAPRISRADRMLYMMSGIMMFMTHVKTMSAVSGADGPTSAMMKHSPMNTIVAIAAAALSSLYLQVLSVTVILYFYHCAFGPITIEDPVGMSAMFLLSWASGIAIGMIIRAATPWAPDFFGIVALVYKRANMIASGKMFVANAMPSHILAYFDWNPLFHTVDQGRGFIFLNYFPHYSSIEYAVKVTIVCFIIGLMGEHFTRRHASASWGAGR